MVSVDLKDFVAESNRIEGIHRVKPHEIEAHQALLRRGALTIPAIVEFVWTICQAPLRREIGMNVYVGNHVPPPGGPDIVDALDKLLIQISEDKISPYEGHHAYETLHPMSDGNGRSGRAIWAWHMKLRGEDPLRLGFLHSWYYQSLENSR